MLDPKRQKQVLLARLEYYRSVFPHRPEAYRAFKLRNSIPRIYAALRRLEDGTYGQCAKCSEDIGHERLQEVPGALFCLECQKEIEAKNKQRARLH